MLPILNCCHLRLILANRMANQNGDQTIAVQAISGSFYSIGASLITWTLGAIRLILLTRLLLPADVGVFVQAMVFIALAARIYDFGLNMAVIHRQDDRAALLPTFFTLRVVLVAVSLSVLAMLSPAIGHWYANMPMLTAVLLALVAAEVIQGLNTVQMAVLDKNLAFRRLAVANVASSITMTLVAPLMAWQGMGVWALVGEQASGYIARFVVIWTGPDAWRARFGWDDWMARWLMRFGGSVWLGGNLNFLLDRFDDFWVGSTLGAQPLGYYGRAYDFARYSRRVVGNPILTVFRPTYARLQDDRQRLSRAFFRATSVIIRVGGLFSLIFILTASEFIPLILGEQWLPMLRTFQLMIIYTFLDPVSLSAAHLLNATGYPNSVLRIRAIQVVLFIPLVIYASSNYGIEGVAVAADIMVLLGTILLFHQSRRIVDYSQKALWFWPVVAGLVIGAVILILAPVWQNLSPWITMFVKIILITVLYAGILWLTEREQLRSGWQMVWGVLGPKFNARKSTKS